MDLVLASGSPRRTALLKHLDVPYRVVVSEVKEGKPRPPWPQWVQELARLKAQTVASSTGEIVLAADTIVVKEGKVLGKPTDEREAEKMLTFLSGDVHEVFTGICVVNCLTKEVWQEAEVTRVYFRSLAAPEIQAYLASGESLDKAGAYGIQGLGGLLIEKIEGCYDNVVGLPLVKTMILLRKCGVPILGGGK
ncbi:MAG: Maf family protein [Clostridia bacterium]|jgi:septum formation protein|nr:Maf family protein [Clostridia bacterium]